jgi:hypothetical protein
MPVSEKKRAYAERLRALLEHNKSVIIVHCDNVGSRQMQQIRIALRGTATVAMGKNTTIRKVRQFPFCDLRHHVCPCSSLAIRASILHALALQLHVDPHGGAGILASHASLPSPAVCCGRLHPGQLSTNGGLTGAHPLSGHPSFHASLYRSSRTSCATTRTTRAPP